MNIDIDVRIISHNGTYSINLSRDSVRTVNCITIEFPKEASEDYSRNISVNKDDLINSLNIIKNRKNFSKRTINIPLERDSFNTNCDDQKLTINISDFSDSNVLLKLSGSGITIDADIDELIESVNIL